MRWDAVCAQQAFAFCDPPSQPLSDAPCTAPHRGAGCNDAQCETTVCSLPGYEDCCLTRWDSECVRAAQAFSARHEGFGFGAGVVQAANDAVKAAAAAREKEAREAAAAALIKSGDAAGEEVIWWPVDAVEPAPGESSEEEVGIAFALVEAGQKPLNPRVVGYEISCCSKNELNLCFFAKYDLIDICF